MKYITILGDGWSDIPNGSGITPLIAAKKPNIDKLAAMSVCGMCSTVPDGMKPGSDVANMSVMGFDPAKYYTGRSPLEAASMGIALGAHDVSYRCNLVTLGGSGDYADLTMDDYSAGEIDTETARKLIAEINEKYAFPEGVELYAGVSYRHCLVVRNGKTGALLMPPHDISGKCVKEYLPKGENAAMLADFMSATRKILAESETNKARVAAGKKPVSSAWLWGEGTKPSFDSFFALYGLKGAVISAVDLVKGLGLVAGMDSIDVSGATGTLSTNFAGKASAAIEGLKTHDYIYVHIEAPDECGHQGDFAGKTRAIEIIDEKIVVPIFSALSSSGEDFKILITPDHPTPVSLRTHTSAPVPFFVYDSRKKNTGVENYNEYTCNETGVYLPSGNDMLKLLLDLD